MKLNKKKIMLVVISLVLLLFVTGCADWVEKVKSFQPVVDDVDEPDVGEVVNGDVEDGVSETEDVTDKPKEVLAEGDCKINTDCEQGKLCIDGSCGTIEELYNTDCNEKCSVNKIVVTTSDGETYEIGKGQGSYSFAGALEWSIKPFPDYCLDGDVKVPISLKKKTLGKVLEEEIITLSKGQTSKIIKHPTVGRINFTVTLKEIRGSC